jgi:hypothetical protein
MACDPPCAFPLSGFADTPVPKLFEAQVIEFAECFLREEGAAVIASAADDGVQAFDDDFFRRRFVLDGTVGFLGAFGAIDDLVALFGHFVECLL